MERCLSSSTNKQYTITLFDSYGDSWTSGSYLAIYGEYGNVVFKNFLTASSQETFQFSLYYGIEKDVTWKMTYGSVTNGWTAYSFSDSTWSNATLGSVATTVSGTQYFRKQFVGLVFMAAYDVRLYYKAGVIAYINGAEVYRDNMPSGIVTSNTAATGEYTELAYRGFIRPGSEVASQQSILAVEIHFLTPQTTVDFNAYLAILAASTTESNCFIYGDTVNLASSAGSNIYKMFDFSKHSSVCTSTNSPSATVTFSSLGPKPYINAIRVWPYASPSYAPSTFTWQGSNNNQDWSNLISVSGTNYASSSYKTFEGALYSSLFSDYRINMVSSNANYICAYEIQPLICSIPSISSITFTPNSYTFWKLYEQVHIQPDISGFTACSAGNLPEGLSIDYTTCVISGIATETMSSATITVYSTVQGNTYTGSFTLTIQECPGVLLNVLRTYKSNAHYESFDIKDAATNQVILSVAPNSGQPNNEDWASIVCATGNKYTVTVGTILSYWQAESYLYVNAFLFGYEVETIIRLRYDSNVGFSDSRAFSTRYAIPTYSNWYHKHGEVPSNWYSSTSTEGWSEGNSNNFPYSVNQIQLYKKTFTVANINNIAGFVLSIKYKYGCIVYLNGHEAFRKGLTDATISTSSYANNIYTDTVYHQISLPIKTVQIGDTAAVNYIQQGSNIIAIGLVAANENQKEAIFDCALRLMGEKRESRVFDYSVTHSSIVGDPSIVFSHFFEYSIYAPTCEGNDLTITFNNDRHEWINEATLKPHYLQNTQQPRQFVLKARNGNDEWITLTTVTDLSWSQTGQAQTIYFQNNKAYNQYRFENFATGDSTNCFWKLNTLDLKSVLTAFTIPDLYYPTTTIYQNIEMGEVYPNSEYFYNFSIQPELPAGIHLDPNTGMISGTASALMQTTSYTITANKLTGGTSVATFSLSVDICTGGRSLITLVARTDNYPEQSSYKLYQGIGTTGTIVASADTFPVSSGLNYADFCMEDGIYTLELFDSAGDGWSNPAGYFLTVDVGEMIFEMGQIPSGVDSVSTMFSSYLPFQIEYSDWKTSYELVDNWNSKDFNDNAWASVKANQISTNVRITTYIRKEVNIPDIANYHVLNVRVKYTGGVVAYFNGQIVARFNLKENFSSESMSLAIHNANTFSKFHIILSTVGGTSGKNIMAFEIHRPIGQSSSSPVVFDATGVFGVNECSIVVDSFANIDGSTASSSNLEDFLDLNPVTFSFQPNEVGSYLYWEVENLEGTKFNSFGIQAAYSVSNLGFSLYVRKSSAEEYTSTLAVVNQQLQALTRNVWSVPAGTAGFNQFKYEVDVPASDDVIVNSYILQYCKASGSGTCLADGKFPSVGEGEISPAECEYGYRGYLYRLCTSGQLGEVKYDKCIQKIPEKLEYSTKIFKLALETTVAIPSPSYVNIIEKFYLEESQELPAGLSLNVTTGEITGIPTTESNLTVLTIYGENQSGVTFTKIYISVNQGYCEADGNFETTPVGEVAVFDCGTLGSYVGTQKRECKLGKENGEWQKITGFCMPVSVIVIIVVVVVLFIVICVVVIVYIKKKSGTNSRKTESVKIISKPVPSTASPVSGIVKV